MTACSACPVGIACRVGKGGACVFVTRHRRAGQCLYLEGEMASSLWYLKAGTVALVRALPGCGEAVRAVRGEGLVLGIEILSSAVYLDTARALTDVRVCGLPRTALVTWLGDAATPARVLLEQTVRGLLVDAFRGASPDGNASRRVARWILTEGASPTAPPLPRRLVASMLGMVPETLSRALAELSNRGAIDTTRRKIVIRDRRRLLAAAGHADDE